MVINLATVLILALPPAPYDHEPVKNYRIEYVSEHYMRQLGCRGDWVIGCTVMGRYILLNEDLTPAAAAHVLRHEKGHVNGWQHD